MKITPCRDRAPEGRLYFDEGNDPAALFAPYTIWVMDINYRLEAARFIYGHVIGALAAANGMMFTHDTTNTLSAFSN